MRALILLALLGAAVAVPKNPQRIVGGTPTTVQEYPYIANMQYGHLGVYYRQACGGALLNERSVLSAAHCYYRDRASEWRVRVGTSQAATGGTVHNVAQLILHPNYSDWTSDNDVAVVRLATQVTSGPSVGFVSVPGANYNLADGTPVTTIGWGLLNPGGTSPQQLQHVEINIINQQYCAERYAYLKTLPGFAFWPDITANMLCAGIQHIGGKDACQGDSGGPMVHRQDFLHVVVGLVSWGYSCAHADYPGVNARVNHYTDWIVANA